MHGWYDANDFVSIRYYTDFGGGLWWTSETLARKNWYGVTGYPTLYFQGLIRKVGASTADATGEPYRADYLGLKGPSPYKLTVTDFDAAGGHVDFLLEVVSDPGSKPPMQLRSVLYEDALMDGTERHDRVARDILAEQAVTVMGIGDTQTFSVPIPPLDPTWVVGNLNVVGFVQVATNSGAPNYQAEIFQAATSEPKPSFSLSYYAGERAGAASVGSPTSLDDFVIFNVGSADDIYNARIVPVNVPAGWTAAVSDGTSSDPTTLSTFITAGSSHTYHLEVTPADRGYAIYDIELFQDGAPSNIETIRYTVLTDGLPILVVDDDGGETFEHYFTDALDAYTPCLYGVWPRSDAALTAPVLSTYRVVIWNAGWAFPSIDDSDRTALGAYLDGGGRLFITGQDIGWEMDDIGGSAATWYQNYLHARYLADDTNITTISGIASDPIGDGLNFNIAGGDGADNQEYPSQIAPRDAAASSIFSYGATPSSTIGGIKTATAAYKLVYLAFGYEAISTAANREVVMQRIIDWLTDGDPCPVTGCAMGRPDRIESLKAHRNGNDLVFQWLEDAKVEDGYNLYQTDDKTLLDAELNAAGGCGDCTAVLTAAAPPATLVDGVDSGRKYYQMLGSCGGGTESPN